MKHVLNILAVAAMFGVGSVLVTLASNAIGWRSEPWYVGLVRGAVLGFLMGLYMWADAKGWIKFGLSRSKMEQLEKRRATLATERQTILQQAREKQVTRES